MAQESNFPGGAKEPQRERGFRDYGQIRGMVRQLHRASRTTCVPTRFLSANSQERYDVVQTHAITLGGFWVESAAPGDSGPFSGAADDWLPMPDGPTHASPQRLLACTYLGLVLGGLIHGIDREEVLAPNFHDARDFREAVLRAVNLGDDADTTGAVCGQLAGAYWGESGIPAEWLEGLARRDMIEGVIQGLVQTGTLHTRTTEGKER